MADTKISALTAGSALGGTEAIPAVQAGTDVRITPAQLVAFHEAQASLAELIRDTIGTALVAGSNMTITVNDAGDTITLAASGAGGGGAVAPQPGYLSGNWYQPFPWSNVTAGNATSANLIRFFPFVLPNAVTVDQLGGRIGAAGTNVQYAWYAANPTTHMPTGTPLISTGNIAATSASTNVGGAVTPALIPAGLIWAGANVDNAATTLGSYGAIGVGPFEIGTPTLSEVYNVLSWTFAATFGTWPDLTSAALTRTTTNVYSVPFFHAQ